VNLEVGLRKDVPVEPASESDFVAGRPMCFFCNGWCGSGHDVMGHSE
jgi:hypothetical protein